LLVGYSCNAPEKAKNEAAAPLAISEIEAEIKNYISQTTQKNAGFFPVKDENHDLKMKLVRVHTEYLSNLGPTSHFACVDLVYGNHEHLRAQVERQALLQLETKTRQNLV